MIHELSESSQRGPRFRLKDGPQSKKNRTQRLSPQQAQRNTQKKKKNYTHKGKTLAALLLPQQTHNRLPRSTIDQASKKLRSEKEKQPHHPPRTTTATSAIKQRKHARREMPRATSPTEVKTGKDQQGPTKVVA